MTDSPLRLLLEFEDQAQRDRTQPSTFLHRRDRKFALVCEEQGVAPDAARWLGHAGHCARRARTPGEELRCPSLLFLGPQFGEPSVRSGPTSRLRFETAAQHLRRGSRTLASCT